MTCITSGEVRHFDFLNTFKCIFLFLIVVLCFTLNCVHAFTCQLESTFYASLAAELNKFKLEG